MIVEIPLHGGVWKPSENRQINWRNRSAKKGVFLELDRHETCYEHVGPGGFGKDSSRLLVAVYGYLASSGAIEFDAKDSARRLAETYLETGAQSFNDLDGQYCAVLFDYTKGVIIFVNDKLGLAQGFLHMSRDKAVFATSLRDLAQAVEEPLELDPASLGELFTLGFVPAPGSMFKNVTKLAPATLLKLDEHGLRHSSYYTLRMDQRLDRDPALMISSIEEHLNASVRRGLPLGRHWGSFLSGGIDSSSVVWSLSQQTRCDTYFATFGILDSYMAIPDEESVAASVAAQCQTDHHVIKMDSGAIDLVRDIVAAIEEPFCDGGPIVLESAARMAAADGCNVLATGNGGDFLFAGERRHLLSALFSNKALAPIWFLARVINSTPNFAVTERMRRFRYDVQRCLALRKLSLEEFYTHRFGSEETVAQLIHPDLQRSSSRKPVEAVIKELKLVQDLPDLSKMLYLDLKLLTPNLIVRDVRTIGDAHGLKTYHPYFDQPFVEMAMAMPLNMKIKGLTLKHALRTSMRPHLPRDVFAKKKGGLGAPILYWVADPNGPVADVLTRESVERRGILNFNTLDRLRRETWSRQQDHSMLLWTAFTLELWMQEFIDKREAASPLEDASSLSEAASLDKVAHVNGSCGLST